MIEVAIVFRIDVQMTFIAPYRYAVLRFPRRLSGIMSFLGLHHKGLTRWADQQRILETDSLMVSRGVLCCIRGVLETKGLHETQW